MADNVPITAGSGTTIATDDVSAVHYQKVKLVDGTADSSAAIPGDATNGLDVDVTRLPALVAGTANIGDVDVVSQVNTEDTSVTDTLTVDEDTVVLALKGCSGAGVQITGTWNQTLFFEGTIDGTNWFSVIAMPISTATTHVSGTTANGQWIIPCGGLHSVRVRTDAFTSGTATVTIRGCSGTHAVTLARSPFGITPGTANTDLGKAEDASFTSGSTGVLMLGRRNDVGTVQTDTDGDLSVICVDQTGAVKTVGCIAHDEVDGGDPVKIGMRALSHGTNPTAVAAADRTDWLANRAGIPWVMGGHPNTKTAEYNATASTTDDNILPAISAGTIYVITAIEVTLSKDTSVTVGYRIGFGTSTVPAEGSANADAVDKVVSSHPGLAAGSGVIKGNGGGIIGIGGDGEELRITCGAATGGKIRVVVTYYTIAS